MDNYDGMAQHCIVENDCYQSKKDFVPLMEFLGHLSVLSSSTFLQHTDLQDNIFAALWAGLLCQSYPHIYSFPVADRLLGFCLFLFTTIIDLTMEERVHTLDTCWISFSQLG